MGAQPFSLKFALHRSWLSSSLCTSALAASSSSALAAHWPCQQGLDQDGSSNSLLLRWRATSICYIYISNSSTATRLHHRVRKLTGILGSFDLLHHTMGAVFGLNKVYTVDLACNASIQVLEASWIVLNASRAVLEASWSPGGVLEPSWSPLGWGLGVSHQI